MLNYLIFTGQKSYTWSWQSGKCTTCHINEPHQISKGLQETEVGLWRLSQVIVCADI